MPLLLRHMDMVQGKVLVLEGMEQPRQEKVPVMVLELDKRLVLGMDTH